MTLAVMAFAIMAFAIRAFVIILSGINTKSKMTLGIIFSAVSQYGSIAP